MNSTSFNNILTSFSYVILIIIAVIAIVIFAKVIGE